MTVSSDQYQIKRYPGGINATRETVATIKDLIVQGSRSFPVRRKASEIVTLQESRDTTGEITQIYNWLRSHVPFRQDPHALELLETPERAIEEIERNAGYGLDCDGMTIVAGALLQSLGHPIRLILTGNRPAHFDHIYLEAYSRNGAKWIPVDLAMPQEGIGWSLANPAARAVVELEHHDLIPGPWPASEVDGMQAPESLGKMPADYQPGKVLVMPDGGAWIREGNIGPDGYWRLARQVRSMAELGTIEWLEPEPEEKQWQGAGDLFGLQPRDYQKLIRSYANENQELFILLTQPDANPPRLRRLFGFRRPPEQRRIYRRELARFRREQDSLPKKVKARFGEDRIKVPMPGHTDGNSAGALFDHFEQFHPAEITPDAGRGGPIDPMGPDWSKLLPDPDSYFGSSLWNDIAASVMMQNLSVQMLLDTYELLTGEQLAAGAAWQGTEQARTTFVDMSMLRLASTIEPLTNFGEPMTAGAIIAIIAAIVSAAAAIGTTITGILVAAKDVVDPALALIAAGKTQAEDLINDGAKAIKTAKDAKNTFDGWVEDFPATGDAFLDDLKADQVESMNLALVRDNIERLYRAVRMYGFNSPEAGSFRFAISEAIELGPMFFCLAKERVLRDLRQIKILALQGEPEAEQAWKDLTSEMYDSGTTIYAWTAEYASLPWDLEHIDIPGLPSPDPPTTLPEGNYPFTDDDEDRDPYAPDDEIEEIFDNETSSGESGWSYPGSDMQWSGPSDKQAQPGKVGRGNGIDVSIGPGGELQITPHDSGILDVGDRKATDAGWISRHPILATGTLAAIGVGGWYGWKAYGPALKALLRRK